MSDPDPLIEAEEPKKDDYALGKDLVADVLLALATDDHDRLEQLFDPLHPADIADLLEQVDGAQRRELILFAGDLIVGEVLSEVDEDIRVKALESVQRMLDMSPAAKPIPDEAAA